MIYKYMYGYKPGDKLLNENGVCTTFNEVETVHLMDGWKRKSDKADIEIVTTPDRKHFLIGISVAFGNSGWGYAPSITGVAYSSRAEALKAAYKKLSYASYITDDACKAIIKKNYTRFKDEADQLWLF